MTSIKSICVFTLLIAVSSAAAESKPKGKGKNAGNEACASTYREKGYVTDSEKRWSYFTDVVIEFESREDGSVLVAFEKSARRYELVKGADAAFVSAAKTSLEKKSPVHVAVEERASEGLRPGMTGNEPVVFAKVYWIDATKQHPSCR